MNNCHQPILPFKVGQLVEAKSFQKGYRGAWFKCKIKRTRHIKGHLHYALEYVDFPDERIIWTKVYQQPPSYTGKSKEAKRELMVRPSYPPMHHENIAPEMISEVIILVNDHWKVGDLMDCWIDSCHWSGKVTKILGGNKAEIKLMPAPAGEDLSYTVCLKDVRPSLDWSPRHGWALPDSQDGKCSRCCGRLIHPKDGDARATTVQENNAELTKKSETIADTNGKSIGTSANVNFNLKETSIAEEVTGDGLPKVHLIEETTDNDKRKRSCSNSYNFTKNVSDEEQAASGRGRLAPKIQPDRSTRAQETNRELKTKSEKYEISIADTNAKAIGTSPKVKFNVKETSIAKEVMDDGLAKIHMVEETTDIGKRKKSCSKSCNVNKIVSDEEQAAPGRGRLGPALSMLPETIDRIEEIRLSQDKFIPCEESSSYMDPDTPEAAVFQLEELLSKVKWLKGLLKSGTPISTSDAIKPKWKFVEN